MSDREICFSLPGVPVAFARTGTRGKRRFTPAAQASYMKDLRGHARVAMRGHHLFIGPVELVMTAVFPYPKSWSPKKKAETIWKTSRPDFDNCAKICADSLSCIVYLDDAQVVRAILQKIYGELPALNVTVRPAPWYSGRSKYAITPISAASDQVGAQVSL